MDVLSYRCWSKAECGRELCKYELSLCDHLAQPLLFSSLRFHQTPFLPGLHCFFFAPCVMGHILSWAVICFSSFPSMSWPVNDLLANLHLSSSPCPFLSLPFPLIWIDSSDYSLCSVSQPSHMQGWPYPWSLSPPFHDAPHHSTKVPQTWTSPPSICQLSISLVIFSTHSPHAHLPCLLLLSSLLLSSVRLLSWMSFCSSTGVIFNRIFHWFKFLFQLLTSVARCWAGVQIFKQVWTKAE